jgi:hypothetical protein
MSMFDFFQAQRQLWLNQPTRQQPEYLAGGTAALDQAAAAFRDEPPAPLPPETYRLQQGLAATKLKLQRQNSELQRQQSAALKLQKKVYALQRELEKRPKWGARARRHLKKLNSIANDPEQSAEARLAALTHLLGDFLAEALTEQAAAQTPPEQAG